MASRQDEVAKEILFSAPKDSAGSKYDKAIALINKLLEEFGHDVRAGFDTEDTEEVYDAVIEAGYAVSSALTDADRDDEEEELSDALSMYTEATTITILAKRRVAAAKPKPC